MLKLRNASKNYLLHGWSSDLGCDLADACFGCDPRTEQLFV